MNELLGGERKKLMCRDRESHSFVRYMYLPESIATGHLGCIGWAWKMGVASAGTYSRYFALKSAAQSYVHIDIDEGRE